MEQASVAHTRVKGLILSSLFAALTAVGAFIKIPTPLSSFTLQVFFVCMAGILLGAKWGALSQVVYVGLGLIGLPIFTGGGGIGYVVYPTFGFLLSYIPMAAVIGYLGRKGESRLRIAGACIAGVCVMYLIGLPYMGCILNLYMGKALSLFQIMRDGMLIFLPWDALKIVLTVLLAERILPLIGEQA